MNVPINKVPAADALARMIVAVAFAYENDYDWQQHLVDLEKTQKAKQEARAAGKEDIYINFCREHYHRQSLADKAAVVCGCRGEPELAAPVYLSLKYFWNDILDWAKLEFGLEMQTIPWSAEWQTKMDQVYEKYADKKVAA